jgi:hypothetical protein
VGLIGGGQEIHIGEEEGLGQWRLALEGCQEPERWTVHAPTEVREVFDGCSLQVQWNPALNLDTAIRFHLAGDLHLFVERFLGQGDPAEIRELSELLWSPSGEMARGIRLWATRDLEVGKRYLRERYAEDTSARYGLMASARDKCLPAFGVDNEYQATKNLQIGAWFTEGEEHPMSCRRLEKPVTEFQAQGLELDMALLAWGTDYLRDNGAWSDRNARKYRPSGKTRPRDPSQMRQNAYRVLLTRGRDGTIVFVPSLRELDETWAYLLASGFRELL